MKSLYVFFPLICFLCVSSGFAQGTWESVGPYGGWINDMKEDNAGRLLAATSFGGIYRSGDNAESWQQIYSDTLIFDPRSIAVNSSGHILVGSEGIDGVGLLRSTDDGATWAVLPNALSSRGANNLLVTDGGDVFACTIIDGLYRSTDGGTTFAVISSFPSSFPTDIEINSSGHLFVGTRFSSPYLYRSTDNGTTWVSISSGITTDVTDVHVSASDDIYAANAFGVYKSTNNGDNWTNLNAPGPGLAYTSVIATSNGDIYASFYGGIFTGGGIYRSTDDGTTWVEDTGLSEKGVARLLNTSNGMFYAGEFGHGVYRRTGSSAAGGSDWVRKVNGMRNTFITSIDQDTTTGYVYTGTRHLLVHRSTDNGLTWLSSSNGIADHEWINAVAVNSDGTVFASGVYNGIYRSTDQGSSWSNVYFAAATALKCNVSGHVFAGYGGRVYRSTDNGDSWTSAILPSVQNIADIAFDGDTVYAATGSPFGFGSQGVYRSTDNGDTWGAFNDGLATLNVTSVSVAEPDIFDGEIHQDDPCSQVSCGTDNGTYDLNQSNNRWGSSGLEGTSITSFKHLVSDSINQIAVAAAFLYARKQTCSWIVIHLLGDGEYSTIKYANLINEPTTGAGTGEGPAILVGTNGYGIHRGTDIILSVDMVRDNPYSFSLSQNYPNPFNPTTIIRFEMRDVGYVSLKVHDLLGREVATLVNEKKAPGTHEVTWDATGLASGVYFYRLRAVDVVQTKKLVLLR